MTEFLWLDTSINWEKGKALISALHRAAAGR